MRFTPTTIGGRGLPILFTIAVIPMEKKIRKKVNAEPLNLNGIFNLNKNWKMKPELRINPEYITIFLGGCSVIPNHDII